MSDVHGSVSNANVFILYVKIMINVTPVNRENLMDFRHTFPGMSDDEFINYVNGTIFMWNILSQIELNEEEQKQVDDIINFMQGNPVKDVNDYNLDYVVASSIYFDALTRLTGYTADDVYNGKFPFEKYPTVDSLYQK